MSTYELVVRPNQDISINFDYFNGFTLDTSLHGDLSISCNVCYDFKLYSMDELGVGLGDLMKEAIAHKETKGECKPDED